MMKTLRFRMMLLFCSVVGILLAASYGAFWILLAHEIPKQLNRQLLETAQPILADMASEPNARDVERLDIPGQFFETLDANGKSLQRSHNLSVPMNLGDLKPSPRESVFGTAFVGNTESVRVGLIPFHQSGEQRYLAVAIPTLGTNRVLDTFGKIALLLLPLSLLLTAAISAFYVGRSLQPIGALTRHAAFAAKHVTNRQGFWTPLPVVSPHDELGHLAVTFNHLLESVDGAVRQLRQFVTDASHELRTPLAVLHGETELTLSRPRTASEYRKTLATFEDELKKLTRIVEGLFTLSMADAGQLHLLSEPLYINEVLEEACALVTSRARSRGISIVRNLDSEIPHIGDEAFLHQLFLIFLDNAIKYSPPGTRVHVTAETRNEDIRVQFSDQGQGISRDHLPHIFERFYRASSNLGCEPNGGGLGLAIAQAIARAQGGAIECESEPGFGSTFTITLPLTNQAAEQAEQKLIFG
jgi:signal transduction histidine kinase